MTDSGHESNALKILQTVDPPFLPERPQAITFTIEYPPGHPGAAPHRHPGPAFGYVVEGEIEIEGELERVLRAGDAFPMLTFVDADELESRHDRRAPRP
jgi:quercetin dioxygenase-like cupin family protein